jgi:hypothetical protein
MCSWHKELAMELKEEIREITCALARADDSRSRTSWMELVEEKELYLSMNSPRSTYFR